MNFSELKEKKKENNRSSLELSANAKTVKQMNIQRIGN